MSNAEDSKNLSKTCILNAAAQLFAKLGLDKCSTREIAKRSDSNISLISYYFGGKEGLYKEVMRAHALKTKEAVQEILIDVDNHLLTRELFIEDMTKVVDHLIQSHIKNPELSKIFAREKLAGLPYSKEIHTEIFYPLIKKFFKLFEAGQQLGFVKKEINSALFFILISEAIWGFFSLMDCDSPLNRDCQSLLVDPLALRNQIINIYLTGALQ